MFPVIAARDRKAIAWYQTMKFYAGLTPAMIRIKIWRERELPAEEE